MPVMPCNAFWQRFWQIFHIPPRKRKICQNFPYSPQNIENLPELWGENYSKNINTVNSASTNTGLTGMVRKVWEERKSAFQRGLWISQVPWCTEVIHRRYHCGASSVFYWQTLIFVLQPIPHLCKIIQGTVWHRESFLQLMTAPTTPGWEAESAN